MQSFCFLFISRQIFLLPPSRIYHLRLSRWEEKQEQEDERKRQKTAFIIRNIGFQATDLCLPREHENGKMPSKFPACWSVNQLIRELQYHIESSVFLGRRAQTTAALASSCTLFLPQFNKTCYSFKKHKKCYDAEQKACHYMWELIMNTF